MSQIFISYSHKDAEYAQRLHQCLLERGFDAWIDQRLDYGSQWPLEIQKQLDACRAFIVIVSPRSYASEWVQSELQRAKRKTKAIFPLLLEGDEPWLSLESTQLFDVRSGNLPDDKFFAALKRAIPPDTAARTLNIPGAAFKESITHPTRKTNPWLWFAALFLLLACLTIIGVFIIGNIWTSATPRGEPTLPAQGGTPEQPSSAPAAPQPVSPTPALTTPEPTLATPSVGAHTPLMTLIPAGEFMMGYAQGDTDERPVHTVELDAYLIDIYEVTNAQYDLCIQAGFCADSQTPFRGPEFSNHPVVKVDWNMAKTYCEWRGARLPSEAEWEKAARGDDQRLYPWGNDPISCQLANYGDCGPGLLAVGLHPEGISPYGLFDMTGNVWEWVADYYSYNFYSAAQSANPIGPSSGNLRVIRGGSWGYDETYQRVTLRYGFDPAERQLSLGFRCASNAAP